MLAVHGTTGRHSGSTLRHRAYPRLAPYLRYHATRVLLDDHAAESVVLMVFDDAAVEAGFLERLDAEGPLGAAWRVPGVLEPVHASP